MSLRTIPARATRAVVAPARAQRRFISTNDTSRDQRPAPSPGIRANGTVGGFRKSGGSSNMPWLLAGGAGLALGGVFFMMQSRPHLVADNDNKAAHREQSGR